MFNHPETANAEALYHLLLNTRMEIRNGNDTDYASGVCHTLRMLGMFSQGDIDRWSVTPIRAAYDDMLTLALSVVGEATLKDEMTT